MTDPLDQLTLSAMVDYWISPNAVKKDFEIPKCVYHVWNILGIHLFMYAIVYAL